MNKKPESTQQELVGKASEEAGFSNHSGRCSILQIKTGARCLWKKHCTILQKQSPDQNLSKDPGDEKHSLELTKIWSRSSKDQSLVCIDIEVSSPLHGTAWIRISRGVTRWHVNRQNSHQKLRERDAVFVNGVTAVVHAQPEDPDLCIGIPIAFHPTAATIRPIAPKPARFCNPGIGEPIAFQSPSVHGKDTTKPREIHMGERCWYIVGYSVRNSPRAKDDFQRIHENYLIRSTFHDVDGACQRFFRHTESLGQDLPF